MMSAGALLKNKPEFSQVCVAVLGNSKACLAVTAVSAEGHTGIVVPAGVASRDLNAMRFAQVEAPENCM